MSEALSNCLVEAQFSGHTAFAVQDNKGIENIIKNASIVFVPHEYAAQHAAQKLLDLETIQK